MKLLKRLQSLGLSFARYASERLGGAVTGAAVERWSLPFDHKRHRVPRKNEMRLLFLESGGALEPNDFYPLAAWRQELPRKRGSA